MISENNIEDYFDKQPICLNLSKALSITHIFSEFENDEIYNIELLLRNVYDICKCDTIAFIPNQNLINKDFLTPLEKTNDILRKNNNYEKVLNYLEKFDKIKIIFKDHLLNKIFECSEYSFFVISKIILNNKYIGCIISLYLKDTLGYKLFSEIDINYYELAANIISGQIKSYLINQDIVKINLFRKNLNELSFKLYQTPSTNMIEYIQSCLEITCKLWNIDRGYLFIVNYDKQKMIKLNEYCAENVLSLLDIEKEVNINDFPWNHILFKFNKEVLPIHIENINKGIDELMNELDIDNQYIEKIKKEIAYLKNVKLIKSILLIPIIDNFKDTNYTIGILGFSQVLNFKNFEKELIDMLSILSCYIAEAIKRYKRYILKCKQSKYIIDKISEWTAENEKYNNTYLLLKEKMSCILNEHTHSGDV